jgi:transposase
MDVLYPRCAGLDIHKKSVTACVLCSDQPGHPDKQVRTFRTMTADLLALQEWLATMEVTHVAMESTGVYWKPVWNLLEEHVELLLVNARHAKGVPGRKTDVGDAEWLADLLRHGLVRASFVPDRPEREVRELTRYRTTVVRTRSTEINRLQKTLEGATSSWPVWSARSPGSRPGRCWPSWWPGRRMPPPWPIWRSAVCGTSCRNWSRPSPG